MKCLWRLLTLALNSEVTEIIRQDCMGQPDSLTLEQCECGHFAFRVFVGGTWSGCSGGHIVVQCVICEKENTLIDDFG